MGAVTLEADIAATKARLLAAESSRDSARLYGTQEKYRQSCSLVEALVREVERLAEAVSYARLHLGLPAADAG